MTEGINLNGIQIAAIRKTTESLVINEDLERRVVEAEKLLLDNLNRLIEVEVNERSSIENRSYKLKDIWPIVFETLSFGMVRSDYTWKKVKDIRKINASISELESAKENLITSKDLTGASYYLGSEHFLTLPHVILTSSRSILAEDTGFAVAILRSAFAGIFSNVINPEGVGDENSLGGFLNTERYLISSRTLEILKTIRENPSLVTQGEISRWEEYSSDPDLYIDVKGEFTYKITPRESTTHRERFEGKDRPKEIAQNDIELDGSDKAGAATTIATILDRFHRGQQEEGVRALHQLMKNFAAKQVNRFLSREQEGQFPE